MKKIIYISPGPTFRPDNEKYKKQWKLLSKNFGGYIFTSSNKMGSLQIDNFELVYTKYNRMLFRTLFFYAFCLKQALKIKYSKEKISLIATYDPLKTGLIGLLISKILKAHFAPEVNGVYTSPAEWIDDPDSLSVKIKKNIYPYIIRFTLKHADGIRLLYESQIDVLKKYIGKKKIISDFHCFVPTTQFSNIGVDEEKIILFAGFPFKRKGIDILIKAFKRISEKYPDWRLKILGWFPDTTKLYAVINSHPQIFHHPPVHAHEMPGHIGTCAMLVLPSRSEAMGRVLVEANAAGKPVIGARVDGIPSVIDDGVNGLLFEPENIKELSEKLELLITDPDLRKKLGIAGIKKSKKEFAEATYISNIVRFYSSVITVNSQSVSNE